MKRILIAVMAVFLLMGMSGCGVSTQPGVTKVRVGAGPFEDPHFKECVPQSTKNNAPTNDDYYAFPTSERDMDATGAVGSDFEPITVVSDDNAELSVPVIIRFNMVTDCAALEDFFQSYGQRYQAYLNDDGTATDGWNVVIRKLMYDPTDALLDRLAKGYDWREMWNDADVQTRLQAAVDSSIQKIVDTSAKGHYFDNYVVLVKKPTPTNPDLVDAIAEEQSSVARAQSAEARARAQKLQAEAEVAVARAEAEKKRSEIAGFLLNGLTPQEAVDAYNESRMIEQGLNPRQPTYLVNGTNQ